MLSETTPVARDLVLVGGGHAHVAVIRAFAMRPDPGTRITLVSPRAEAPYSGMLPGLVAGHYDPEETHVDLVRLAARAGARFVQGAAEGIDTAARLLFVAGRPPLRFDVLSLDIGGNPSRAGIAGADGHAIAVKPVDRFLAAWNAVEARAAASNKELSVLVVGAGAGGMEIAMALSWRARSRGIAARLAVACEGKTPMPGHPPGARARMERAAREAGVSIHREARIVSLEKGSARDAAGRSFPCDVAILATPVAAPEWLARTGLALDKAGFVAVDAGLRSLSHSFVFAAGDVAAFTPRPLPKSGVYAVRQGPALAEGLRAALRGADPPPYRPQRRTLSLLSTGGRHAVASWGPFAVSGEWVWRLKDRIDRRWIETYAPRDSAAPIPDQSADGLFCGGCAAKADARILHAALDALPAQAHDGVSAGLASRGDAALIVPPPGNLLVQSADFFPLFLDDPFLTGRIAANHALGDLHAVGAAPHSALALVTLDRREADGGAETLRQMLAGATVTLEEAGAALLGGHTATGPATTLGFAVNGWLDPDKRRTNQVRAGDALVLTKALGTGIVLAAHMRAAAPAATLQAAIAGMLRALGPAAQVARAHEAHATTDVTGFGLAGHVATLLRGTGLEAVIDLDALPLLDGAPDLARRGARSSLHAANAAAFGAALGPAADHPASPFLFDPQTAGGLLVALPAAEAPGLVTALRAAGDGNAAVIGRIQATGDVPRRDAAHALVMSS